MSVQHKEENTVQVERALVEVELQRVLKEKRFASSRQMSAFLEYIVNETLDGREDRIKAYTVGIEALGKPHTFDAQTDPSVRVLALRLRKALKATYQDESPRHAMIVLKVGSYVPEFYTAKPRPSVSETVSLKQSTSEKFESVERTSVEPFAQNRLEQQPLPNKRDNSSKLSLFERPALSGHRLWVPVLIALSIFWLLLTAFGSGHAKELEWPTRAQLSPSNHEGEKVALGVLPASLQASIQSAPLIQSSRIDALTRTISG